MQDNYFNDKPHVASFVIREIWKKNSNSFISNFMNHNTVYKLRNLYNVGG